ncbi:DUF2341 domain-containing protein [Patescibacteria group bacterium]|nr:DUF2341 domain-containing protein [Candidatus Falkowbacteria bacterium]MBU4014763.1 DUF2341 domain-containing protein [Patescibacteria group bacterium]MBU4026523.1 DUF2341 domain-containing protein [Patescibacteria group bacterium]MBU4073037.1 DUF2341 domain-containing protein [Patescibacteria group bacterium]MBU4102856.1 DUF2341 domain-containing protein [Patescibacteria group bacterium]
MGAKNPTSDIRHLTSDTYGHLDPWYSSSYQYKRSITLNASQIATTTDAFPVLATTTLADLKTVTNGGKVGNDNGYDIIFVDDDDATLLNFEREYYASTTGEIAYWIKTDISSTTDKVINMYYGNSGASDVSTTTGVWDDNYVMVNHLAHDGVATTTYPDFLDSTQYDNDGSSINMNSDDLVDGQVDGSLDFDGADDEINVIDSNSLDITTTFALSAWIKPISIGNVLRVFDKRTPNNYTENYGMVIEPTGEVSFSYNDTLAVAGNWHAYKSTVAISGGVWTHAFVQYTSATPSSAEIYINGTKCSGSWFVGNGSSALIANSSQMTIGWSNLAPPDEQRFNGLIDEVRISNVARSAGWIATEYNNQSAVGEFLTIGAEEWGELDITTAPKVIKTGVESTAFTVQIPHNAVSDVTVNLSSDSSGTNYFASTTGGTAITAVTIQTGSSSVNFYYKDYKPGAPTITVAADNFTSDTQQQMVQGVWQNTSYQCRRQITLQGSKIATTTTAFPILATTTLADLKTTANGGKVGNDNGYDIIFVDSDDSTLLNYEREKYASTTGEIAYWIKTDIASSTDKTIYMYYGNAGASDTATTTGVWDNNFVMVNHLAHNGIATTTYPDFNDSTKYANNGSSVNMNSADLVDGQVDGSLDFDGVDDYVNAGTGINTANIVTVSAWIKANSLTLRHAIYSSREASGVEGSFLLEVGTGNVGINRVAVTTPGIWNLETNNNAISVGSLYHIAFTKNGATQKLYINGISQSLLTDNPQTFIANSAPKTIGVQGITLTHPFSGLIDEVRVSNTARTAGWITTEYNNQSSVGSFMTIGAEVCMPVPAERSGGGENVKTRIKGGVRFRGGVRF